MPTKWFAAYDAAPVAFLPRRNRQRITTFGTVGAQHSKEVAHVNSIKSQKTAQTPSFGMSAYGQTSLEASAISAVAGAQVSTCARVRHIGDMGLAATTGDFPEIRAWRPPSC
jgi:hypothetical protein